MLLILILLTGLIVMFHRWGRHRLRGTMAALVVGLFLAAGCGPLPQLLLQPLQAPYAQPMAASFGVRSAIVLLGAGTVSPAARMAAEVSPLAHSRVTKAAELYHGCRQAGGECKVVASGGDVHGNGDSEGAVYVRQLAKLGVPETDLIAETRSQNTWENARYCEPLLAALQPDRVYLVTSGLHLTRSMLYFEHFGIRTIPVRADYLDAAGSVLPLAYNLMATDFALHEYLGIARFHVYNALGWNPPARG
ncbi:YdcF family protein [Tahibacter amnicola]|uniref:YdcF family protein n=1 Tax=Tahibacter amnicola TaxID=2976241 RepID=UPI003CCDC1E8